VEADQAERLALASPIVAAAIEAAVENKKPAGLSGICARLGGST